MKLSDILSGPEKWCQTSAVQDCNGKSLDYATDPNACRWCLYGAVSLLSKSDVPLARELDDLLDKLVPSGYSGYIEYNDTETTTFDDIKNLIEKAEKRLEGQSNAVLSP